MKIPLALAVAATVFWLNGCATYEESNRAAADRALESNLRAEMSRYGDLAMNSPNVRFDAREGNVTIAGTVRTEREREMLTGMVRNTIGVGAVHDELRVLYPPTGSAAPAIVYQQAPSAPAAPVYSVAPPVTPSGTVVVVPSGYPNLRIAAAAPADEVVARRVGERLVADGVSPAWLQNVTIRVTGENAYLQGSVDGAPIRQAVVSSVSHAKGVKAVYDQLQVR